jgi:hypothetical protein
VALGAYILTVKNLLKREALMEVMVVVVEV